MLNSHRSDSIIQFGTPVPAESIGPTKGTDIYFGEKKKGFFKFQMDYLFNLTNANGIIGNALFIKGGLGLNIN